MINNKTNKKIETANYPWVFWVNIGWRKWFTFFWKTRGANFMDIQIWRMHISIGMPWYKGYLKGCQRDHGSAKNIHKTNQDNLKAPLSVLIKAKHKPQ